MNTAFDAEIQQPPAASLAAQRQRERIRVALGGKSSRLPMVSQDTLGRYYRYLSANLVFPFAAGYPGAKISPDAREYQCQVLELIDPAKYLGDGFDGMYCKTRKGAYELNLPLIDLHLPEDNPNFQLIDDYWCWFWNWRW